MARRSASGAGSIRQRPDGRWEARYTAGRNPGTGRQMQKSVYGATQDEVVKKLRRVLTQQDEGTLLEPSRLTIGQWLDTWMKEYTGHLKPRTKAMYQGNIDHRLRPALGAVKLQKLTAPQVQACYNSMGVGDNALSPKTIKNLHGILHSALQKAVEVGYIRFNPTEACTLPRVEKVPIKPLDEAQIGEFLKAIQGHRFETFYTVTLFTGMRQGEALGLGWDSIDFQKGTIFLHRQLQLLKGQYSLVPLKNDKTRTITPAASVMQLLKEHKRQQTEWQLKAGPAWDNVDGFVFTDELGNHLARQTVYQCFKSILGQMGYDVRFHDLRHSYAVVSLAGGDDIKTVQENLGHHTAAFTLDTYAHATEQMKKDSAARMDTFIKGIKGG